MPVHKINLIHPVKNAFALQAAKAFQQQGILNKLFTTYFYSQTFILEALHKIAPAVYQKINNELKRRDWQIDPAYIVSRPWIEYKRILLLKTGWNKRLGRTSDELNTEMYEEFDKIVSKADWGTIDAVYAYEDCAQRTFERAKKLGITCFYDLPIVHYKTAKEILGKEVEMFPEFQSCLATVNEPAWKILKKLKELELADLIFVPSNFVKQSIIDIGIPAEKIKVNVFGAPIEYFKPMEKTDTVFRAIFVGGIGPRKGVHYIIQAWKELNLPNAELLLVGVDLFPEGWLKEHIKDANIRFVPSVPHHQLNSYYASADVFVFPSLAEGLALVQLEAMACGLPIISTPNAGAEDIVEDGKNGFLIPIRDTEALKDKIQYLYSHPDERQAMSTAARVTAERFNWKRYQDYLLDAITSFSTARIK
ncbi:MAG: glycosyltransferase family 4 protein [Cytophagales bacterium]|nr:glycosyltransferase family 4 protein [Cytophaga sp.]